MEESYLFVFVTFVQQKHLYIYLSLFKIKTKSELCLNIKQQLNIKELKALHYHSCCQRQKSETFSAKSSFNSLYIQRIILIFNLFLFVGPKLDH